jgi:hypothetical protein
MPGMSDKPSIADQIISSLREFNERLRRGESIKATRVRRYETPDGPMHTFEKVTLPPIQGGDRAIGIDHAG